MFRRGCRKDADDLRADRRTRTALPGARGCAPGRARLGDLEGAAVGGADLVDDRRSERQAHLDHAGEPLAVVGEAQMFGPHAHGHAIAHRDRHGRRARPDFGADVERDVASPFER